MVNAMLLQLLFVLRKGYLKKHSYIYFQFGTHLDSVLRHAETASYFCLCYPFQEVTSADSTWG